MHAEVYRFRRVAVKLCPATVACQNEVKYLEMFTTMTMKKPTLHHFPVCLGVMKCRSIAYQQNRLNIQALDGLVEDNKDACLAFMRAQLSVVVDPNSIQKRIQGLLGRKNDDISLATATRYWKSIQSFVEPTAKIDGLLSVGIIVELASWDLRMLMEKNKQSTKQLANMLLQVCIALLTLDSEGLQHGDLHSGNILIKNMHRCSLKYNDPIKYELENVENYVLLWDFETIDKRTATENVLEDCKRLFNSLATNPAITELYSVASQYSDSKSHKSLKRYSHTMPMIHHLDTTMWRSVPDIMAYLQAI